MIDPAATLASATAVGGAASPGGALPAEPGKATDPALFANLLALGQTSPDSAPAGPAPGTAAPVAAAGLAGIRQGLAALPAGPALAGTILPVAVPDARDAALVAPLRQEAPVPAGVAVPGGVAGPALPLLRAVRPAASGAAAPAPEPASAAVAEDEGERIQPDAQADPACPVPAAFLALPSASPAAAAPAVASAPAPAPAPIPVPAQGPLASSAALLPQAIVAQMPGQPLPAPAPATVIPAGGAAQADEAVTEPVLRLPAAPARADLPFTLASAAAPQGREAVRLRPVIDPAAEAVPAAFAAQGDALAGLAPDSAMPPAIGPAAAPAPAANSAAATAPAAGYSFADVVDRLIAARDMAAADGAARPVAVALRHGEFGEVAVRFEQRPDGLSVALSSPDPDFARAVQAAAAGARAGDAGPEAGAAGQSPAQLTTGLSGQFAGGGMAQQGQRGAGTGSDSRPAAPRVPADPATSEPGQRSGSPGIYA